jgi:hypothetical protein
MPRKEPRNYREEYDNYHGKPEQRANRSKRVLARRDVEDKLGKEAVAGKDVHHKNPLRNGGGNSPGNLAVSSVKANRGWNRKK